MQNIHEAKPKYNDSKTLLELLGVWGVLQNHVVCGKLMPPSMAS
jgi:hypothetical protein